MNFTTFRWPWEMTPRGQAQEDEMPPPQPGSPVTTPRGARMGPCDRAFDPCGAGPMAVTGSDKKGGAST